MTTCKHFLQGGTGKCRCVSGGIMVVQKLKMNEESGVSDVQRVDPVPGTNERAQGTISMIQHTGETFHFHAALEQVQFFLDLTSNAVLITGPDQRILQWNRAAERTMGYPAEYLKGRLISDFIPLPSRRDFITHADRAIQGERIQDLSLPGFGKSDYMTGMSVAMTPLHDPAGIVSGMMLLLREDIGESVGDMRLFQHLSDMSVRIKGPLSHMRTNIEETVSALQEGLLTTEELVIFLTLQMKSIAHLEESLQEINAVAIEGFDSVPEEFRKYMSR